MDGNGAVNSLASHAISCVGSDARGYRAAWLSGPEKSRHTKHSVSDVGGGGLGDTVDPSKRGFVARIFDISGREPRGIGGGVPFEADLPGLGGIVGLLLPNPNCLASLIWAAVGGGGNVFRIGRLTPEPLLVPFVSALTADGRRGGSRGAGGSSSASYRGGGSLGCGDDVGRGGCVGRGG
jgi:hypothetical protein